MISFSALPEEYKVSVMPIVNEVFETISKKWGKRNKNIKRHYILQGVGRIQIDDIITKSLSAG